MFYKNKHATTQEFIESIQPYFNNSIQILQAFWTSGKHYLKNLKKPLKFYINIFLVLLPKIQNKLHLIGFPFFKIIYFLNVQVFSFFCLSA